MTQRVVEFDDYPWYMEQFLTVADRLKNAYQKFCCTIFAIPRFMHETPCAWDELSKRSDWIRVGVHGFEHHKRETRLPDLYERGRHWLDKVDNDPRWSKVFKSPWYGYCEPLLDDLQQRGYSVCATTLYGFPMPMPAELRMWNVQDARASEYAAADHKSMESGLKPMEHFDIGRYVVGHPVWPKGSPARIKSKPTEMSERMIRKWTASWQQDDEWAYVDDLARPALVKLNLGSGDFRKFEHGNDLAKSWTCLDPRSELDPRIVEWDFSRMIPFSENKADIVLTSHVLNYIPKDQYIAAALDIWRVLRPNGIWRMQEDCCDVRIWRRIGSTKTSGTGRIESLPTKQTIYDVLERVGFEVHDSVPGETLSDHKDVLKWDSRGSAWRKGWKFYAEAIKRVPDTFDISRPRWHDIRAVKRGRYQLPKGKEL